MTENGPSAFQLNLIQRNNFQYTRSSSESSDEEDKDTINNQAKAIASPKKTGEDVDVRNRPATSIVSNTFAYKPCGYLVSSSEDDESDQNGNITVDKNADISKQPSCHVASKEEFIAKAEAEVLATPKKNSTKEAQSSHDCKQSIIETPPSSRKHCYPYNLDSPDTAAIETLESSPSSQTMSPKAKKLLISNKEGWAYVKAILRLLQKMDVRQVLALVRKANWDDPVNGISLGVIIREDQAVPADRKGTAMKNYFQAHTNSISRSKSFSSMFSSKLKSPKYEEQTFKFKELIESFNHQGRHTPTKPAKFKTVEEDNLLKAILITIEKKEMTLQRLAECLKKNKLNFYVGGEGFVEMVKKIKGSSPNRPDDSYRTRWRSLASLGNSAATIQRVKNMGEYSTVTKTQFYELVKIYQNSYGNNDLSRRNLFGRDKAM